MTAAARRIGAFLLRHWRGALSPLTAWLAGGVLAALLLVASVRLALLVPVMLTSSLRVVTAFHLAGYAAIVAIAIWAVVGIWRAHAGGPFWKMLAGRSMLAALLLVPDWRLPDHLATAKEMFQLARGRDPLGPTASISASGDQILIDGVLSEGTGARFIQVLGQHPKTKLVVLQSSGGRMMEAETIADAILAAGLSTYADDHCISACTVAMAAGRERMAGHRAKIGFHQATMAGQTVEEDGRFQSTIVDALTAARVAPDFIGTAMETPAAGMWFPSYREMTDAGFLTRRSVPDQLADIAERANEGRGAALDDHFYFVGAEAERASIYYVYRLGVPGLPPDASARASVTATVCKDEEFSVLIEQGAEFNYFYVDMMEQPLGRITVDACPER